MVTAGVYTPRTARCKIEEIDKRMKLPALEITSNSRTTGRSLSESNGLYELRSPTDRHSSPWDIEEMDMLADGGEDN